MAPLGVRGLRDASSWRTPRPSCRIRLVDPLRTRHKAASPPAVGRRAMFPEGHTMAPLMYPVVALMMFAPIALAIWVLLTLSRIRRGVDRVAAAVERLVDERLADERLGR